MADKAKPLRTSEGPKITATLFLVSFQSFLLYNNRNPAKTGPGLKNLLDKRLASAVTGAFFVTASDLPHLVPFGIGWRWRMYKVPAPKGLLRRFLI